MSKKVRFRVAEGDAELRLDQLLARNVPELSRRKARVLLDIGGVFVDRRRVKVASRKLPVGAEVEVVLGGALERATGRPGTSARQKDRDNLPDYRVVFEDDSLVVVDKPPGLLTAPTPESDRSNLADDLARRGGQDGEIFVVHRIDMDTSGLLVFAKTRAANRALSEIFRTHRADREYIAVAVGAWPESVQVIREPVDGRPATSHVRVVERFGDRATRLAVKLETGRTHQIRIHCAGCGYPIAGDQEYGSGDSLAAPRLALHARLLGFVHPVTETPLKFESELSADLAEWVDQLRSR